MLFCDNCNGGYIYSSSNQSSFKFPSAFGTIHHVLLQHLDFYSNHATFFPTQVWGGIQENFISTSSCALYIYVHASFFGYSFYLWLVLVFLFNGIYYGFTPLQHRTSRHCTSRHLSCLYAWPHTWQPITSMPIMPLGLMYDLKVNVCS
jgi:hypothetical protein